MYRDLEHPEITHALRTGYPSWMTEDEEDEDAYDEYCESCYEERRERELFGD